MSERLNRAITQLQEEGLVVSVIDDSGINVGGFVLTNIQVLELLDNDQLTWQGIKDLGNGPLGACRELAPSKQLRAIPGL